jgi:hypothetical protein
MNINEERMQAVAQEGFDKTQSDGRRQRAIAKAVEQSEALEASDQDRKEGYNEARDRERLGRNLPRPAQPAHE